MSSDRQLVPLERLPLVAELETGGEIPDADLRRSTRIRRILRERLVFAILLGVVGMAVGGYLGFRSVVPIYRGEGIIDIAPYLTTAIEEKSNLLPMFDAYVQSQAAAIRSPRVLNMAMDTAEWRATGRGVDPESAAEFRLALNVEHPFRTRMLLISFGDPDPSVAAVAVNAVLNAYEEYCADSERRTDGKNIRLYTEYIQVEQQKLEELLDKKREISKDYGSVTGLQTRHQHKYNEVLKLEEMLNALRLELVELEAQVQKDETGKPREMSLDEIAVLHEPMRLLLRQRLEIEAEIRYLTEDKGYGENAEPVQRQRRTLEQFEKSIEAAANSFRKLQDAGQVGSRAKITTLKAKEDELARQLIALTKEVDLLHRLTAEMQRLLDWEEQVRQKIDNYEFRIVKEQLETGVSGRIEILARALVPIRPSEDKRKQMAALAGMGGAGLGFLLVILIGLLDRRCRTSDSVQESVRENRLLGLVPSLKTEAEKADNLGLGTHCLHHVRAVLQVGANGTGGRTLAITSPSAGTGKTTLTTSLGFSFSNSGSRTLLIDCDFLGKGLTALMDTVILRRIERLLELATADGASNGRDPGGFDLADVLCCARRDHAEVERETLEELLKAAVDKLGFTRAKELGILDGLLYLGARGSVGLDELPIVRALKELGHREQGGAGLDPAAVSGRLLGLFDALEGENLESCVRSTGIPKLSVLTLREGQTPEVGKLSPSALSRIFEEAKSLYDTVLIDTGPILGSLEASIVSTKVDGVVVAVSRGEQQPLVERALGHLSSLGANVLGLVFNKARIVDVIRSSRPVTSYRESRQ